MVALGLGVFIATVLGIVSNGVVTLRGHALLVDGCAVVILLAEATDLVDEALDSFVVSALQSISGVDTIEGNEGRELRLVLAVKLLGSLSVLFDVNSEEEHASSNAVGQVIKVSLHVGAGLAPGISEVDKDEASVTLVLLFLDLELLLKILEGLQVRPKLAWWGRLRLTSWRALTNAIVSLALLAIVAIARLRLTSASVVAAFAMLAVGSTSVGRSVSSTIVTALPLATFRSIAPIFTITTAASLIVVAIIRLATARRVRARVTTSAAASVVIIVAATVTTIIITSTSSAVPGRVVAIIVATARASTIPISISLLAVSGNMSLVAAGEAAAFATIRLKSRASR